MLAGQLKPPRMGLIHTSLSKLDENLWILHTHKQVEVLQKKREQRGKEQKMRLILILDGKVWSKCTYKME